MAALRCRLGWPLLLCWISAIACSPTAHAQAWVPQRHVELVTPTAPGGALDNTARTLHRIWTELKLLPVSSAVVNRAGGEHALGYTYVRQRTGDPHILSLAAPVLLSNHISGVLPFTYTDVTPIAILMGESYLTVVKAESPVKSASDLIETLRQRPGAYTIGVGTILSRIAGALPLQSGSVDVKRVRLVAFASSGGGQNPALLGAHVDVAVTPPIGMLPHIESGAVRALATSGQKRMGGALSSVPTWAELGYEGAAFQTWRAVIAPKDLAAAQIAFWEGILRRVTETDEFRKAAERNHWDITFRGPTEALRQMDAEYAQMKRVMGSLGLIKSSR
jgi:putative tricarboxylic transport membrane protein